MATLAARVGKVKVSAAGSVFTEVGGVDTIDATGFFRTEQMDTTQMGDTGGRSASSGFSKASVTFSGKWDPSDAGIAILLANLATCFVQVLPDGTTGWKARMCWDLKTNPKSGPDAMTFTCTGTICDGAAPTTV